MKKMRISLLIPFLLILSSLGSSTLLFVREIRVANRSIEHAGFNDINTAMTHLQNILDTQLADFNLENAKLSLSVTALHPNIQTLLLTDDKETVLLANSYIWAGNRAALVSGYDEPTARQVRRARTSFTALNSSRTLLSGYYPITLKIAAGGVGSSRLGVLFVEYDLTHGLAQSRHNAVIHAAVSGGLMVAVAIAVALLLHRLVSRRVTKIVAVSQQFAAGDYDARLHLQGSDELAELGRAFDRMAEKIATDQRALRDSEHKLQVKALLLEEEIEKRQRTQEELEKLNEQLEQRVKQRTTELEKKNEELQKTNRIFVGRELRMVELKKRIRELEKAANKREL